VKWNLENGSEPNIPSSRGFTALEYAAYKCLLNVVKLLVDHSADIRTTTAVHSAAVGSIKLSGEVHPGRFEITVFLLNCGANIDQLEPETDSDTLQATHIYGHRAVESEDTSMLDICYGEVRIKISREL
jgi:hypothetical protein